MVGDPLMVMVGVSVRTVTVGVVIETGIGRLLPGNKTGNEIVTQIGVKIEIGQAPLMIPAHQIITTQIHGCQKYLEKAAPGFHHTQTHMMRTEVPTSLMAGRLHQVTTGEDGTVTRVTGIREEMTVEQINGSVMSRPIL